MHGAYITPFSPDKHPMRQVLLVPPFYIKKVRDREWLANLPKDTNNRTELEPGNMTPEHSE